MKRSIFVVSFLLALLSATSLHGGAGEAGDPESQITLSPELAELLRTEMREISAGVQMIPLWLATADWASIEETSGQINASYIMKQKLTPAQAAELGQTLPEAFKKLDAQFHARADRLGAAAATKDYELVAFQFSRLVESCATCHEKFAASRFPGFQRKSTRDHHH